MGLVGSAGRDIPGPLHFRRESRYWTTRWLLQAPERSQNSPGSTGRRGSRRVPTAPCGSPTSLARASARSGGSAPPGWSPTTPAPAWRRSRRTSTSRDHGRSRRRLVVHQLRQQLDRADQHDRKGHPIHRPRHRRPAGDHGGSRRRLVVHQLAQQLDRADQHDRGGHQLHRHRHRRAAGDHGGSRRRVVVHQPPHRGQRLDRADQYDRGGHQLHRHRHRRAAGDHGGSRYRPRPVFHQLPQQLDRADQYVRGGYQLHRHRHRRAAGNHGGSLRRRPVVHQRRQ